MLDEHAPIAMIDPQDIGEVAAKLLSLEDPSSHFRKKYNLSGPEDVTGKDVVSILEQITQKKIQVNYRDLTLFKFYIEKMGYPKSVSDSLESGRRDNLWIGLSRLENTPTSPEILQLAPPHSTIKQFIQQAFNQ
ncbi:unnamed protein product [Adineta steineri]|uniref:Uncharacterized protein n=1 Tax=Adineta steineri TaxID=433720 RepID=A0A813XQ05_9BILA|nr:unnamed protein product [Adineta steineri]CAF3961290.1 unnamed protein product [Adineta steineri]